MPFSRIFSPRARFAFFVMLLFALALTLRLFDLSNPPFDFHPTRQLFSAVKARGIYYQTLPSAPAWQKEMAVRQWEGEATIEPPLLENAAAYIYRFTGEQLWIPRALSAIFWTLGGVFLFLLARNLTNSPPAATVALAFYLFLPYGMTASRAFQPDPLMVMFLLIFWWAIENWGRRPSWSWTFVAGLSGGLAIFVKFPAVFFVLGGALGAILAAKPSPSALPRRGGDLNPSPTTLPRREDDLSPSPTGRGEGVRAMLKTTLKRPQTWVLALLGVLPSAIYLYYGLYVDHFLGQQFNSRFFPELWIDPYFYLRWFLKADLVVSPLWISLAFLGWLVFSNKPLRTFLSALWGGYFIFGMAFAHHISSHDYYSLPLIPMTALSLAPLAAAFVPVLRDKIGASRLLRIFAVFALFLALGTVSVKQYLAFRANDYRPQAAFWAEVGAAIGHQPSVLALTSDYGYPLAYYGWQNSALWPPSGDVGKFITTFRTMIRTKSHFLITDFDELARQPALQTYLRKRYPVLAQGKGYIVYDLMHRLKKAP